MNSLHVFEDPHATVEGLTTWLINRAKPLLDEGRTFSIALSGGSTPQLMYQTWSTMNFHWKQVHFFWGDERCVPPDHPESNFGSAKQWLFDHIEIPLGNIHRIRGEDPPELEATRYREELLQSLPSDANGTPILDLVILGMGTDGHVASIFPNQIELMDSDDLTAVATHPATGQFRVTLTGRPIIAAKAIAMLVTGAGKAPVLEQIIDGVGDIDNLPGWHVRRLPQVEWFIDNEAASRVKSGSSHRE